jgi:hypothetical protein
MVVLSVTNFLIFSDVLPRIKTFLALANRFPARNFPYLLAFVVSESL